MARMTGGQAVLATLKANGVTAVFGIPGMHNLPIYDALYAERRKVRHILARHEGGAGLMANGYARATGQPGVATTPYWTHGCFTIGSWKWSTAGR